MSVFDMVGHLYGGLLWFYCLWQSTVKHPGYKIIGFVNIEV